MLLDASLRCVCGWRAGFIQVDEGHIYLTRGLAECVGEQGSSKFVWGTLICARVVGGTINNPPHSHFHSISTHNPQPFPLNCTTAISTQAPRLKQRLVLCKAKACLVTSLTQKVRLAMAPLARDRLANLETAGLVKCSLCSAEIGLDNALRVNTHSMVYRCRCCNKLATRLQRCSNRPSWKSKEEKERFFNDHNNDSLETLKTFGDTTN